MQCPVDGATLVMAERSGVEIDYCPKCRGVWLDRGELDKIIERAGSAEGAVPLREPARGAVQSYAEEPRRPVQPHAAQPRAEEPRRRRDDDDDDYRHGYKKRRKESFLGDLFDF